MAKNPTLLETLTQGIVNAVDDVRHKVVEEPFFGRETTKDIGSISTAEMLGIVSDERMMQNEQHAAEYAPVHDDKYQAFLDDMFGKDTKEPEAAKTQEPAQEMER
jgi:hypothetical protein